MSLDALRSSQMSLNSVVDFLQTEFRRFERERAKWEIERSDLQAKIASLEGERKGQENLKQDLVRRIKMLEFALKNERSKNFQRPRESSVSATTTSASATLTAQSSVVRANMLGRFGSFKSQSPRSRHILRQYLEEIGIADPALKKSGDLVIDETQGLSISPPPETRTEGSVDDVFAKETNSAVSSGDTKADAPPPDDLTIDGTPIKIDDFLSPPLQTNHSQTSLVSSSSSAALAADGHSAQPSSTSSDETDDQDNMAATEEFLSKLPKDKLAKLRKLSALHEKKPSPKQKDSSPDKSIPLPSSSNTSKSLPKLDLTSLPSSQEPEQPVIPVNAIQMDTLSVEGSASYQWKNRYTLRSHFDGVRGVAFHHTDPLLVSASEDGTAKLWNLRYVGSVGTKKTINSPDIEPIFTYRGHIGPIFTVSISKQRDVFFTAGSDATIRQWELPGVNEEPYSTYGRAKAHRMAEFIGHSDAIWSLDTHPIQPFVLSASSDGTVKLWDSEKTSPLVCSFGSPLKTSKGLTPTSAVFLANDLKRIMVGYSVGSIAIFDIETNKCVTYLDQITESTDPSVPSSKGRNAQINQIVCHPTLPLVFTAHEDNCIRYIDASNGALVHAMTAHTNAVSSISVEHSGLCFLSTGHDSSIRFWDVASRKCVQEFTVRLFACLSSRMVVASKQV
eukprot:TRINITY_DN1947_c0_g2_i1.p1 TRINITY_DN1947_c0_g2~~TRINITY_DN1947_c0_g2_i1.p1  ORF type:complete len:675 (+),score=143.54 TRINITY_DN1947_c0_g2_i1:58-2082(+)